MFDRSHGLKTTFNSADLIPVFCDEVLPGDSMVMRPNFFGRMATPITPVLDNFWLDTFWFFVPMRLVWENSKYFFGEKDDPTDTTEYIIPKMDYSDASNGISANTLSDYLGLPTNVLVTNLGDTQISCLPHRAYTLIYNTWFKDENLQAHTALDIGDGPDLSALHPIQKRNKRHDYVTSCLPWPQKGGGVDVPLGTGTISSDPDQPGLRFGVASDPTTDYNMPLRTKTTIAGAGGQSDVEVSKSGGTPQISAPSDLRYEAGLTASFSSTSLNELRTAIALQQFLERDARGGTRYFELTLSHFGVTTPDSPWRPEWLGGTSRRINVNPVANTNSGSNQLGDLSGYVTMNSSGGGFSKSFTEHGYVIGLVNVRADITWQNTLDRMWTRETRYDFFWPDLAHLGEQEVKNYEVNMRGSTADNDTFGYQERYAEYKYKNSQTSGFMNSFAPSAIDLWHLALKLDATPVLNDEFIKDDPPFDRVISVTAENFGGAEFILDAWFDYRSVRPIPVYSTPGLRRF